MPKLLDTKASVKPFLKWAGGKTQLLGAIETKIVPFFKARGQVNYLEPFIGSGAVLFFLLRNYKQYIKQAVISDINPDLINLYKIIRDQPLALIEQLSALAETYFSYPTDIERKEYFYRIRAEFNQIQPDAVRKSALLLFLNKTCFNGLYRVNAKGQFNVPFGRYKKPNICNQEVILADSEALQHTEILLGDFTLTEPFLEENSLVYLDPPYKPLSSTASFNTYAKEGFYDEDQIRLKTYCDTIQATGAYFVLSNSDTATSPADISFFDSLYQEYTVNRVKAKRAINANGQARGEISELLISNDAVWQVPVI
ncbi:restriction endonuclease subunit M [Adhaeribacter aerolatus]|uniref:Site-specific DNA-methyltransferase (adenine-specific) n=1 Tax=Adhaeribacter aerolatus TaxID=670289 RepID=A0A512B206_9BACT|nr:DNA adenine methylase [Adhaeribacter aerolatus]GEO06008.1 restriction endonuclease subunit M [Adhaeribacter aerolatus]